MPSFITHLTIAEKALERIPDEIFGKITDLACYYAGAQGADPFFLYRPFGSKDGNLGKIMHRVNVGEFFRALKDALPEDRGREASYAYGYVTHYAADVTFHPYVYALERGVISAAPPKRRKDKIHFLIERDIDSFVADEYLDAPIKNYELPSIPDEEGLKAIFRVLEEPLWQVYSIRADYDSFRNAVVRFFGQQKFFLDPRGNRRRNLYALESLLFMPHVLSFMCVRDDPDIDFANFLHRSVAGSTDSVLDLAEKAIALSAELIKTFCCAENGKSLDVEKFSSDQNVGKI